MLSATKGLAAGAGALWRQASTAWRSPGQALLRREFRTSRSGAKLTERATLKSSRVKSTQLIDQLAEEQNQAYRRAAEGDEDRPYEKSPSRDRPLPILEAADRAVVSASAKSRVAAITESKKRAEEKEVRAAATRALTKQELDQAGYVISNQHNSIVLVGTLATPEDVLRPRQHANLPGAPLFLFAPEMSASENPIVPDAHAQDAPCQRSARPQRCVPSDPSPHTRLGPHASRPSCCRNGAPLLPLAGVCFGDLTLGLGVTARGIDT